MTPERWQRVKDLCRRALEREPPGRAAFLDETCLDDHELRRQVESLLMQASTSEGVFDAPVWQNLAGGPAAGGLGAPSRRWLPEAIGRYRVRRLVGEAERHCAVQRGGDIHGLRECILDAGLADGFGHVVPVRG